MPLQSITPKQVLLLRLTGGGFYVCDEYWANDGRVHILDEKCYGTFNVMTFIVEFRKAAVDVAAIVYQGYEWPDAIAGSKDIAAILAHFGCANG